MNDDKGLISQVQRHAVALISLVVAVSSFSYTTWRNEQTEENRNQRYAAFEILLKLNELQQVIFHRRYDQHLPDKGNPRLGWTYVLTVQDLSKLLHVQLPAKADQLLMVWQNNWHELADSQSSVDAVLVGIDEMRVETRELLKSLD